MPPVLRRPRPVSPRGVNPSDQSRSSFSSSNRYMRLLYFLFFVGGLLYFLSDYKATIQKTSERVLRYGSSVADSKSKPISKRTEKIPEILQGEHEELKFRSTKSSSDDHEIPSEPYSEEEKEMINEEKSETKGQEEDEEEKQLEEEQNQVTGDQNDQETEGEAEEPSKSESTEENETTEDGASNNSAMETEEEEEKTSEDVVETSEEKLEKDKESVEEKQEEVKEEESSVETKEEETTEETTEDQEPKEEIEKKVEESNEVDSTEETSETAHAEEVDDDEQEVHDENAKDVTIEESVEHPEDEVEDKKAEEAGGPKTLPSYKREELEEKGFGHILYAYRVVAPAVAVRTKPSPIGGLLGTVKDKVGLTKDAHKLGEVVVGYQLSKVYGLWLKLAPHTWMPVNKKESATSSFHPVMKQIRKISLPGNLKRYWRMKKSDCTLFKNKDLRIGCEEKNMIRDGVLTIMRKLKLMTPEMDPDIHPFPSPTKPAKKIAHATSATHVVVPSSTTSDDRSDED